MDVFARNRQERLTEDELVEGFFRLVSHGYRPAEVQPFLQRMKSLPSVAAPFLVDRLVGGVARERLVATQLLRHMAGPRVIVPLRDLLKDQTSSDDARVLAASVLDGIGEEINPMGLAADLKDPLGLFNSIWESAIEGAVDESFCESLVEAIQIAPAAERVELIRSLADPGDTRALRILEPLVYGRRVGTILAAMDAIELLAATELAEIIKERSESDPSGQVRRQARALHGRLVMQASQLSAKPPPPMHSAVEDLMPVHRCWTTLVDGSGDYALSVARQRPDGFLKVVSLQINDLLGIKNCLGVDMMRSEELDEIESDLANAGSHVVPVSLESCCALAREAFERSLEQKTRPPLEYVIWKDLFSARSNVKHNQPWAHFAAECHKGSLEILPRTDSLLGTLEFRRWTFDFDLVAPYVDEWTQVSAAKLSAHDGQKTLDILVDLAIKDLLDDEGRLHLSQRLSRQAWILSELGKTEQSQLAAAAANGLDPVAGVPTEHHPFVRSMVLASFMNAGMRALPNFSSERAWRK